jgi:hypothetical protein
MPRVQRTLLASDLALGVLTGSHQIHGRVVSSPSLSGASVTGDLGLIFFGN